MAPAREEQMLKDLIESSSHHSEFKRRGSFFVFTLISYTLFLSAAGVISILAYEARLHERTQEAVLTMLPPTDAPTEKPDAPPLVSGGLGGGSTSGPQKVIQGDGTAPIDSLNHPGEISAESVRGLPGPRRPDFSLSAGGPDFGPGTGESAGSTVSQKIQVDVDEVPPPPKREEPPRILHRKVINSEALSLPKPIYPPIAVQTKTKGQVVIQVLIDESGKVVSAKVLSGSPLLTHAAVRAAYQARFSPTFIGNQPVKVSGLITYNFVLD